MSSRRAFTVLEVVLVVLLLAVVAAVTLPNIGAIQKSRQLGESIARVRSLVSMCRAEAMNEARKYRVAFEADGSIRIYRQLDPINTPDQFEKVAYYWAAVDILLEDVWVESLQKLPDGPAPIIVEDDSIKMTKLDEELTNVTSLKTPMTIDFEPDGSCESLRWVLREVRGGGVMLTLDGRLGRIDLSDVAPVSAADLKRPSAIVDSNDNSATEGVK